MGMHIERIQQNQAFLKWPIVKLYANLKFSYLDKDSISHKTNHFITRLTCVMNSYIFTFTSGCEILMEQTDRESDHRNPRCACALRVKNNYNKSKGK